MHQDKDIIIALERISLVVDQLRTYTFLQGHADTLEEASQNLLDAIISDISRWERRIQAMHGTLPSEPDAPPSRISWRPLSEYVPAAFPAAERSGAGAARPSVTHNGLYERQDGSDAAWLPGSLHP